jgi:hypothetical protein
MTIFQTWDVGNGHLRGEFVDIGTSTSGAAVEANGHLAIDYTCVVWGSVPSVSKKVSINLLDCLSFSENFCIKRQRNSVILYRFSFSPISFQFIVLVDKILPYFCC